MKISLLNSLALVSFLLAFSPSVQAAELLVDREYNYSTGDSLFTLFHNDASPPYMSALYRLAVRVG